MSARDATGSGPVEPGPLAASGPDRTDQAEQTFEQALSRLEQVVDRLERGDLELEASLRAFEEGVKLSRRCANQLEAAEQRVEILTREGAAWLRRPFASDAAAPDDEALDDEEPEDEEPEDEEAWEEDAGDTPDDDR